MGAASAVMANATNPEAMKALIGAESNLGSALSKLMVVAEAYPDLKGQAVMTQMMEELTSTENKISFSRQREFLADASSAQFTRNPESLASALAKIHKGPGSELESNCKHEMSHFFFAQGVSGFWSRLFATHPPIVERIRELAPDFKLEHFEMEKSPVSDSSNSLGAMGFAPQDLTSETINEISNHQISSVASGKAHLFAVLLSQQGAATQDQILSHLEQSELSQKAEIEALMGDLKLNKENKFNTFKLALGYLKNSSANEKTEFLNSMKGLFEFDQVVDFKEGLFYLIAHSTLTDSPYKILGLAPPLSRPNAPPVRDPRKIEGVLRRWVPWILSEATEEKKAAIKNLAIAQLGVFLSFDQVPRAFSWIELEQDMKLLSRLDPASMEDDFLLLSWVIHVPVSFFRQPHV